MRGGAGVDVEGDCSEGGPEGERGSTVGVGGRGMRSDEAPVSTKGGGEAVVEEEGEDWEGRKVGALGVGRRARVTIGAVGGKVGRAVDDEGGMDEVFRSNVDVVRERTRGVGAPATAVTEGGGRRVVEEEEVDWGGREVATLEIAGVAAGRAVDEGGSVGG